MFKDKYKQDIQKIKPPKRLKEKILDKEKRGSKLSFKDGSRLVAVALSVCILFTTVIAASFSFGGDFVSRLFSGANKSDKGNNHWSLSANSAASYGDIFKIVNDSKEKNPSRDFWISMNMPWLPEEMMESDGDTYDGETPDYSDTNNQVEGVQEGDIIKTDGRYIYTVYGENQGYHYSSFYDAYIKYGKEYTPTEKINNKVYIHSADNGRMEEVSTIELRIGENEFYYTNELLLSGDNLIIIKQGTKFKENENYTEVVPPGTDYTGDTSEVGYSVKLLEDLYYEPTFYGPQRTSYSYKYYTEMVTAVEIYDITDRANPVFVNELYQSGSYNSSRMVGDDLYLITNYNLSDYYKQGIDETKPESFVPFVSAYNKEDLIPASSVIVNDTEGGYNYFVITGIDLKKPEKHISSRAMLSWGGTIYASAGNIYISKPNYSNYDNIYKDEVEKYNYGDEVVFTDETALFRFSIKDAKVEFEASAVVKGSLLNQFAMDEYDGHLRVATTVNEIKSLVEKDYRYKEGFNGVIYDLEKGTSRAATEDELSEGTEEYKFYKLLGQKTYSNLYVLDLDLKETGFITGLGEDERIYSVRFDGEIGYIVTFRQVDPLFAIDLKDPKKPKILSELKIPGFSNYMHPYGDGLLFGLGMDANENGGTTGLKISMFDVSDKKDVREIAVQKISRIYSSSSAQYNHKAILVNAQKNLIGFPVNSYEVKNGSYISVNDYHFYSFENGTFVLQGKINPSFDSNEGFNWNELRGLFIGDYAYLFVANKGLISYDMKDFSEIQSVEFN